MHAISGKELLHFALLIKTMNTQAATEKNLGDGMPSK
jgi:hypothetical protein